jgi:tetratricopeptide (TPR) repeat protein
VPPHWSQFAKQLPRNDHFAWAADCYRRALGLDPDRYADRAALAWCLLKSERPSEALLTYRDALAKHPEMGPHAFTHADLRVEAAALALALAYDGDPKAPPLSPEERRGLRREALRWLRDWLTDPIPTPWSLRAVREEPFLRAAFAPFHHPFGLALLPPEEAKRWFDLWAEVWSTRGQYPDADGFMFVEQFLDTRTDRTPQLAPPPREVKR